MKKIFINKTTSILSIILILSVASCSKEKSESGVTGVSSEKIRITGADANTTTKTTLNGLVTSWNAGDKVGIYSPQARTASGGSTSIANAEFTAASSAFSSSFSGTMYWGTVSETDHTFYAYYPYNSGYSGASNVVPISLLSAQTQSAANNSDHIGALDFMVGTPVTVTSPGNTNQVANEVHLRYNHVFTVLEFQIVGTETLKYVKLVVPTNPIAFGGGTINLNQTPAAGIAYTIASQTGTSKEVVVTLTSAATLSSTPTTVYMVINPGTQTGNCLIGLYDGTTWKYISKAAPSGGFLRGKKYVVAIDQASAVSLFDQDNNVYSTVISTTGKTWLDRNLGATRVATASNDYLAYGSLYQWGRLSDGHQLINWTSSTGSDGAEQANETSTLSSGDVPSDSKFIFNPNFTSDWLSTPNDGLWQGLAGTNNPCPSGFRIPTDAELEAERASWIPQNSTGAYASPLKFTVAGNRSYQDGSLFSGGSRGYYWSSTVNGTKSNYLYFVSDDALMSDAMRALGLSVRCIKD